jgi:hypothetical protein
MPRTAAGVVKRAKSQNWHCAVSIHGDQLVAGCEESGWLYRYRLVCALDLVTGRYACCTRFGERDGATGLFAWEGDATFLVAWVEFYGLPARLRKAAMLRAMAVSDLRAVKDGGVHHQQAALSVAIRHGIHETTLKRWWLKVWGLPTQHIAPFLSVGMATKW